MTIYHLFKKTRIVGLLCIGILCYALFYLANIHILHQLSPAGYGDIAVSIKILVMLCSFLIITQQVSFTLFSPQYERTHRRIKQAGIIAWLGKNLILSAVVLSIGCLISSLVFYLAANEIFLSVFAGHPVQFLIFFAPILAFCVVLSTLFLSQRNLSKALIPIFTIFPSLLIAGVYLLGIYTSALSSLTVVLVYGVSQIVILLIYLFLSQTFNSPRLIALYSAHEHKLWHSKAQLYWVGALSYQLSIALSLVALELLSPEEAVGQYATILLFVAAYYAIISPLHTYLSSQLESILDTNTAYLHQILAYLNRIQLSVICIMICTIASFGYAILSQIGEQYTALYPNLLLAMVLYGIAILLAFPLRILMHSRQGYLANRLKALQLAFAAVLLVVLVPKYGVYGAVIADTIPLILTHAVATGLCMRYLNIKPLIFRHHE